MTGRDRFDAFFRALLYASWRFVGVTCDCFFLVRVSFLLRPVDVGILEDLQELDSWFIMNFECNLCECLFSCKYIVVIYLEDLGLWFVVNGVLWSAICNDYLCNFVNVLLYYDFKPPYFQASDLWFMMKVLWVQWVKIIYLSVYILLWYILVPWICNLYRVKSYEYKLE